MVSQDYFSRAIDSWIDYCLSPAVQLTSPSPESIRQCGSFEKILAMGTKALPRIYELLSAADEPEVKNPDYHIKIALKLLKASLPLQTYREIAGLARERNDLFYSAEEDENQLTELALQAIREHGLPYLVQEISKGKFKLPKREFLEDGVEIKTDNVLLAKSWIEANKSTLEDYLL